METLSRESDEKSRHVSSTYNITIIIPLISKLHKVSTYYKTNNVRPRILLRVTRQSIDI